VHGDCGGMLGNAITESPERDFWLCNFLLCINLKAVEQMFYLSNRLVAASGRGRVHSIRRSMTS